MEELRRYIPRIDDDDDGYDSPPATENWGEECNEYAAFQDHRRMWSTVLKELGMIRPIERAFIDHRRMWAAVMSELGMVRPLERVENRQRSSKLVDAYIDHRWMWAALMGEMIEAVKARNTRRGQRPTKLKDRRGRSLPRLHFN